MAQRVEEGALLTRQERVDGHESGRLIEIVVDQVDAARDGQEPEPDRDEHDEQQAPPENRHRIAEQRDGHQRLVIEAAALDRRNRAGRHPDRNGEQHGEERQLERRGEQGQKLGQNFLLRRQRYAEIAVRETPDVVEKLLPNRLVEPQLMAKVRQPLRRHAVLADPHLHRIARHETDRREGQEHQRQKCRDRERDAAKKIDEHGRSENDGPRLLRRRRGPDRPYWRSTPSNACVPSGLCL